MKNSHLLLHLNLTTALLNRIHDQALRRAYNDYVSGFDSLLKKYHSITIHQRNIQAMSLKIYKTKHDLNPGLNLSATSQTQHKNPKCIISKSTYSSIWAGNVWVQGQPNMEHFTHRNSRMR